MKRILKIAAALLLVMLIAPAFASAQDKKEEKHIKVVIADKDGKTVVMDTVMTGKISVDTLKMNDGKVIIIGGRDGLTTLSHASENDSHVFVTVSDDGKKGEKSVTEVREVEGFPVTVLKEGDGEKVVIVKSGSHISEGEGGKSVTWSLSESGGKGNVIYINEGKGAVKDGEKVYNIEVRSDESGNKVEKTSYVIAKDGMVVTIEGGSEEKVKELAAVIESKLGVDKNSKETKTQVVKEETKKTTKK